MEPGRLRENPPGSGENDGGEWRGETPGVEAEEERKPSAVGSCNGTASAAGCVRAGGITVRENEEDEEDQYKDEELDPRIQEELEHLNQASEEINRLELQLDEARSSYRKILTDSARKLNAQGSQLGACIEKARPYYEARRLAKEAQQETQKAALRYERAVSMHTAAREMVYVAEQGLLADRNTLDPTWQEMLNHATAKEHKAKVVQLEERVAKVKTRYSVALRNLEQISEQIHAQRGRVRAARQRNQARGGRSSPVGAEAEGIIQAGAYGGVGMSMLDNDWADQEKTRQWVEKHREEGWGQRADRAGSDSLSIISLQTIASDLEKCDSVEHLGDLSDVSSVIGEEREGEKEGLSVFKQGAKRESETAASGTERPQKDRENFVKQHHRSVSL
ncbi:SH3 domain-binding protein 5-like isoform X2 [Silurus meridionalis]|uniref:SH3 domain-binding protein 5-like isoform X2 n=1 Tax=Silurus meridionalis TaxID=175797 RepID=UPI001EEA1306|nr:SH3 domain-binding protein 5-like isoform X2 [Silurus meridionalis]